MRQFRKLAELITYHIRLHEGFELRDLYKLLHQSIFGPEHLGGAALTHAILEEMNTPCVGFEEPLLEPISVDGNACRINLRVAAKKGIAPALIARAVRESASKFSRDRDELHRLWTKVGNCLSDIYENFSSEEFQELTRLAHEKGFPPLHHSDSYGKYNRPAYRVLMKEELQLLMPPRQDGVQWP